MRRRKDVLLPIELSILDTARELTVRGRPVFHGFGIAGEMQDRDGAKRLVGHGTLYRALERLEERGLLRSWWEDPQEAALARRPVRRLYEITAEGEAELARAARWVVVEGVRTLGAAEA